MSSWIRGCRRHRGQPEASRRVLLQEPHDGRPDDGAGTAARHREVRGRRDRLLLSQVHAGAVQGVGPLDRLPGGDERALRPGQEDASGAVRGVPPGVWLQLDQSPAGQPVRSAGQLRPRDLARHPRAHPQVPRGQARPGPDRDVLGDGRADPRVPLRRGRGGGGGAGRGALRPERPRQPGLGLGDLDAGPGRADQEGHAVPGRARVGCEPPRRPAAPRASSASRRRRPSASASSAPCSGTSTTEAAARSVRHGSQDPRLKDPARWARQVRTSRPPAALDEYLGGFEAFFDDYAGRVDYWRARNPGYHARMASLARFYVPRGASVLEVGCGPGDLLASLEPSEGVGVDLSGAMIERATARHPGLEFHRMPVERLELPGRTFDYIILSDVVGYLFDIRLALDRLRALSHPRTRIIIHWYSRVWQPVVHLLKTLGLKYPLPILNWTTVEDIENLLRLAGFEPLRARGHLLLPLRLGPISRLANRFLAYLPVARWFVWTNWVVARPAAREAAAVPSVTVVCPCRNEKGNIEQVVRRLPALG